MMCRHVIFEDQPCAQLFPAIMVSMYVTRVPNRGSPPAVLLRESYREAGKGKTPTLANLTAWPEAKVSALAAVEDALAARHLAGGTLVLYDVSSAAFEGRTCPLGAVGHPKDGVHGRLQIVYGLLTSKEGIPVAIEVFKGNTGDPKTVAAQVAKIKDRFAIDRVVLAGDRGMLTAARLREDVAPAQLDWITALRAPQVKKLARDGALQLTLSGTQDLAEITSPDFPGERLVACMNPFLEAERARKRESLLAATKTRLVKIAAAC